MENPNNSDHYNSRLPFNYQKLEAETPISWTGDFDRRFAFSRQASFHQSSAEPYTPISIISNDVAKPLLSRTVSSIDISPAMYPQDAGGEKLWTDEAMSFNGSDKASVLGFVVSFFRDVRYGNRAMRRLFVLISLNVAYSSAELCIGLVTGRIGLVSDAFHLTFGCGLLTFSLFTMAASRRKPDRVYTYG